MLEGERGEQRRFDDEWIDDGEETQLSPSLTDDIIALMDDGKTYAEAEFAFQKTRLAYSAGQGRSAAIFVLAAFGFAHLALVALVVGAVIALSPVITPLGATVAVTVVLVLCGIIFGLKARDRFRAISSAFAEDGK